MSANFYGTWTASYSEFITLGFPASAGVRQCCNYKTVVRYSLHVNAGKESMQDMRLDVHTSTAGHRWCILNWSEQKRVEISIT